MKEIIKNFESFKAEILKQKEQFESQTHSKLLIFQNDGTWDIVMIKNISDSKI